MRVKRDQKLMIGRNSKIHRLEDLKGAIIGRFAVQLGSGYLRAQHAGALRRTSRLTEKIVCDNPRPFHLDLVTEKGLVT